MRGYGMLMLVGLLGTVGCNEQTANQPATSPAATASAPSFTRTAAADRASAAAPDDAPGGGPTAAASAGADQPLPDVKIKTVGMHIGGGPNDPDTKAPIRRAVEAKLDEFRACYALVTDQSKQGTFGLDLRIPAEGGQARIRDPRSGLAGKNVEECMIKAFEKVEFDKPPGGQAMMVSYSLRFEPQGK